MADPVPLSPMGFVTGLALFSLVGLIYLGFKNKHNNGLSYIPGPLAASLSDLYRLGRVLAGQAHHHDIHLHRKYGSVVRLGPKTVSVSSPDAIQKIYGISANLPKSDFYPVNFTYNQGKLIQGIFATKDENLHRVMKRPIANLYSMTSILAYEPLVDETIQVMVNQLNQRFAATGHPCVLSDWLQFYAFDVISSVTFSSRVGFLEQGTDINNVIEGIWQHFKYFGTIGQMPWLDNFWDKSAIVNALLPAKFLQSWTISNMLAGSDTTAIYLRAILYYLVRHPSALHRALAELQTAEAEGHLSPIITYKESSSLPYLDACIKESGRIHPSIGLPLERVVPPAGLEIDGHYLPGGTVVGINAWTCQYDKDVFGPDADEWRPERWLVDAAQRTRMERAILLFGAGHRSCIGKHIATVETYKLVPQLLREFEWETQNFWIVRQTGMGVVLRRRSKMQKGDHVA
ncbi:hypothetical protein BDV12DRAFT_207062 [Aspergillus spectabilis]